MTDEYDPETCLTAVEIRALGVELPENIPDIAWVPRWAMRTELGEASDGDTPGSVTIRISFLVPFAWIELRFQVDADGNVST